ncbi:MAG: hypothetical protein KTR17_12670 [Cellvibrionaceae bacterium]|nr:hypothetical protein [Cellvibrionaceae bacterium]
MPFPTPMWFNTEFPLLGEIAAIGVLANLGDETGAVQTPMAGGEQLGWMLCAKAKFKLIFVSPAQAALPAQAASSAQAVSPAERLPITRACCTK